VNVLDSNLTSNCTTWFANPKASFKMLGLYSQSKPRRLAQSSRPKSKLKSSLQIQNQVQTTWFLLPPLFPLFKPKQVRNGFEKASWKERRTALVQWHLAPFLPITLPPLLSKSQAKVQVYPNLKVRCLLPSQEIFDLLWNLRASHNSSKKSSGFTCLPFLSSPKDWGMNQVTNQVSEVRLA